MNTKIIDHDSIRTEAHSIKNLIAASQRQQKIFKSQVADKLVNNLFVPNKDLIANDSSAELDQVLMADGKHISNSKKESVTSQIRSTFNDPTLSNDMSRT